MASVRARRARPREAFVFGGLRIVWISNDCAWPVRANDAFTFVHASRFPRPSDLPPFYELPFLRDGNESSPFWRPATNGAASLLCYTVADASLQMLMSRERMFRRL